MKRQLVILLFLGILAALSPMRVLAQTYYYDGGKITQNDLRRARPYKGGSVFLLQGSKKGIVWIPKQSNRGNHYLEMLMEYFLEGSETIRDYSSVQLGAMIGGSHGVASVLSLLMDEDARKLLGITKKQGDNINDIVVDFRSQVRNHVEKFVRDHPKVSHVEISLARFAEIERVSFLLLSRLEKTLSEQQLRRAKEMVFQLYGGFDTPVVDLQILSIFDLTKEQRKELESIAEDANNQREKTFLELHYQPVSPSDFQSMDVDFRKVALSVSQKIRETLTSEQQKMGDDLIRDIPQLRKSLGLK